MRILVIKNPNKINFASVGVCNSMSRVLQENGFTPTFEIGGKYYFQAMAEIQEFINSHTEGCECGQCKRQKE